MGASTCQRHMSHQTESNTVPHSPQQNGVAERLNRTLVAMLSHSNLPNRFWAEAVSTAAYLRNRTTNEEHLMRSGMVTSRTSVISRCLGVLPIVMCQMQEENLTRRHEE